MEWVQKSAVGTLKKKVDYNAIQSGLNRERVNVQVRVLKRMTILVMFEELGEIKVMIEHY